MLLQACRIAEGAFLKKKIKKNGDNLSNGKGFVKEVVREPARLMGPYVAEEVSNSVFSEDQNLYFHINGINKKLLDMSLNSIKCTKTKKFRTR